MLIAFITGTVLLIYIQYNSAKNINSLINGNEKYLEEYNINSELKGLEKDIGIIESNISNAISINDSVYIRGLDARIAKVNNDLKLLQQISDDESTAKQIDELDTVVRDKLNFSLSLKDSFCLRGKSSAEKLMSTLRGKRLMDSITLISKNIENTRHGIFTRLTMSNDISGQKAQRFNMALVVLALVCGAGLFWYIINTVRRREFLIQQLHKSEIKIKETTKVKEQFMANMSHEIRTPMNAILGFTNLLQRKNLDEESKEYVETIQRSGENLLTIINDVLDLSKIEAGMMRMEVTAFRIRDLLHSVEVMFTTKAEQKRIKIYIDIDNSVPETLEGDSTRLTQVLINLMGNALKFTNSGSIIIKISNKGKEGGIVKTGISISDSGIGIDKDKQEHIFNRFQQADDTVTRSYGGTGLGLSIVKELVLLQNGTIEVESELGKGTIFRLMIPFKISLQHVGNTFSHDEEINFIPRFHDVRILVVEDNEINQSLIRHLFKIWGVEFHLAINGNEAIQKLKDKKYNMVLMDIQMPVMDGYTTTKEIRETLNLTIPIIAMTAHALAGEREKCLSCGMNDYISKPIREKVLNTLITQYGNVEISDVLPEVPFQPANVYRYISLLYMKEISGGNTEYERTVTEQFIEAIPEDLLAIQTAWNDKNIKSMQQLSHNLKTTISIMGLSELLQPFLDEIEYNELNEESFAKNFKSISLICTASVEEAKHFYKTL